MSTKQRQPTSKEGSAGTVAVKPKPSPPSADVLITELPSKAPMFEETLMEIICEKSNLQQALKRVRRNKGGTGIDGMTVEELTGHLRLNWPKIKQALLDGRYQPRPVRRVDIPKVNSKERRKLGIPSVLDRFIQQAVLQVLQSRWDPRFSENSFGFRRGRSAHQAVARAQEYVCKGYDVVVDIDLEKFFDRVNHDRLMSKLVTEIRDRRVLTLIRSYLNTGVLDGGLVKPTTEGVPQGGPLSPFLSNIVLDELDKELEKRGHHFTRYADDCNVYVKSHRAGERVMKSLTQFITRHMKLKVNTAKSAVGKPVERQILGFRIIGSGSRIRRGIAPRTLKRFKSKIRQLTRRNWNISMEKRIAVLRKYLNGWQAYYGFCETHSTLQRLDSWIRRRLRSAYWKQWKTYSKRKAELIKRNVSQETAHVTAWLARGAWRMSHMPGTRIALDNHHFDKLGLPRLHRTFN
jgi:RNA-directed DNA polymerase